MCFTLEIPRILNRSMESQRSVADRVSSSYNQCHLQIASQYVFNILIHFVPL